MASNWRRLGYQVLGAQAGELKATWTGNYRHLYVQCHIIKDGVLSINVQCGTGSTLDSSSKYSRRRNRGSETNDVLSGGNTGVDMQEGTKEEYLLTGHIQNLDNTAKLGYWWTVENDTGASNIPNRGEWAWKYNNDDQIHTVGVMNNNSSSVGFGEHSAITVWGADDQPSTPFYPNLPNGAIFEESDTGKHQMFDGTSAWNEMT